jgi:biotin carboxyl carrier protein
MAPGRSLGRAPVKLRARVGSRALDVEIEAPGEEGAPVLVRLEGSEHRVDLQRVEGDTWSLLLGSASHELSLLEESEGWRVRRGGAEVFVRLHDPARGEVEMDSGAGGPEQVTAIMPGRVARVLVESGQEVARGQGLVVVEAMKMENEIASPRDGTVNAVRVAPGQTVETGAVLVDLA